MYIKRAFRLISYLSCYTLIGFKDNLWNNFKDSIHLTDKVKLNLNCDKFDVKWTILLSCYIFQYFNLHFCA